MALYNRTLLFAVLVSRAFAWDSRDVNASEWVCSDALLSVVFGSQATSCATEVLQDIAQVQPIVTYFNSSADPSSLYTLIIVDRDAPNSSVPVRSPLRHYAAGNIPASVLATGAGAAVVAWFNYSGPQPPVGSLCHRYYVQLYVQTPGVTPTLADPFSRYTWDFPAWATNNSLSKVAVSYWRTQNLGVRTGPCDGTPSESPAGSPVLSLGAIIGIAVGGVCVLVAASWVAWMARSRLLRRRMKVGEVEAWDSDAASKGFY